VALLPAIFTIVLGLHILFVQRQGMHAPEYFENLPEEKKKVIPFFPNFVLRDALLWLIVLNVLLYLAVFFPWELGAKADPFVPAPEGIRPEWYFMFMFQTLKLLPAHILFLEGEVVGILGFGILAIAWALVPFWEIKSKPGKKPRPMTIIGMVVIVYILALTIIGYIV
jgi:cytochrome b6